VNITEAAVIVFGLFAGYWVVSKLFFRSPNPREDVRAGRPVPPAPATPPWHETLQVPASASEQQIRDAYKGLMSQYHPDKVESLGQELKDLANRKSQEINAAYRAGLAARGVGR
jgi:DnaJ like chaperone protein